VNPQPDQSESAAAMRDPLLGVGRPSIAEAPEVRIAETSSGKLSVWVAGVGYLSTDERHALGRLLAGVPDRLAFAEDRP
jgi:hypothetical protein